MGHRPGRLVGRQSAHRAGQYPEQGDAGVSHHRAALSGRRRHREGLRHRRARRLLRLGRGLKGIVGRHWPLQRLQVAYQGSAGPVVLVLHARRWPRDQGQRAREDQELGRSLGQERLHRPAAVRHPPASRASDGRGRRQAHLQAGRSVHRRLAAQFWLDRSHDHLCRRRQDPGAVDFGSFARGRLGRAQSETPPNSPS